MSYDYILMKGKATQDLASLAEGAMSQAIGPAESVKASISELFPSVRWQAGRTPLGGVPPGWFGRADAVEFQFLVEKDGNVQILMMSRCDRADVECVAKKLGLVAIDEQSMDQFDG